MTVYFKFTTGVSLNTAYDWYVIGLYDTNMYELITDEVNLKKIQKNWQGTYFIISYIDNLYEMSKVAYVFLIYTLWYHECPKNNIWNNYFKTFNFVI